jgi:hypothetical protein
LSKIQERERNLISQNLKKTEKMGSKWWRRDAVSYIKL